MPGILWVAIFFLAAAVIVTALIPFVPRTVQPEKIGFSDPDPEPTDRYVKGARAVAAGCLAAGLLITFLSMITIVPANTVGVATNFGSWAGVKTSGWHLTQPWTKVDRFPTRIQTSERDRGEKGTADCVPVKFQAGATGCVDLTVLYRIDADDAETLWRSWGSFDRLNADLVNRSTDDAAGYVFGEYPPFEAVDGANRAKITAALNSRLDATLKGKGIDLDSVTMGAIHLDGKAQEQVNDLLNKDTSIRSAEKDRELREKQKDADIAAANKDRELAASERFAAQERQAGLTREALTRMCLEVAREVKPAVMPDCGLGSGAPVNPLVQVTR